MTSRTVRLRIAMAIGIATGAGLLFGIQTLLDAAYAGRRLTVGQAVTLALSGWYAWALLSPVVIWAARRFTLITPGARVRNAVIHILASLLLTMGKIVVTTELLRMAGFDQRAIALALNLPLNIVTYWAIVAATYGVDAFRRMRAEELRAERLHTELTRAQLEVLRNQLQPHFLFNTLHSIAELMHQDVRVADRTMTRLSALLRASLEIGGAQEVTLREELAILEHYLDIQKIRFEERLELEMSIAPDSLDALVPPFVLQPIVENAIRHAVASSPDGGRLRITARHDGTSLLLAVEDDGPGFANETPPPGIGLENIRRRLEHLYAGEQRLEVSRSSLGGAAVSLAIPWHMVKAA